MTALCISLYTIYYIDMTFKQIEIMKRDIISVFDMKDDIQDILSLAAKLKSGEKYTPVLQGRTLALIFEKSSTRTRTSFEVGIYQLGGHSVHLNQQESQMGRGETIEDTAKVLSRFADCIAYRAFNHSDVCTLAENASVPVINALDDLEHPCQIIADLLTITEKKHKLKGLKLAYIGDGNNVCNSLMIGCALTGINFVAGCPEGYMPDQEIIEKSKEIAASNDCTLTITTNPIEAAADADVIYTDAWVSMGQEDQAEEKEKLFAPYQINAKLMSHAKKDCIFMHCLPAHRGLEVTEDVIDGSQSVVFDEAENRLHAQKAIMLSIIPH